ncbi:glycosyltransferase family 4 protein [Alphaproteobacteria bacterium]|nr:glycosyltransferase family 4 protein [Alphaproteobacteria bacterium]MDC1085866.1 glycosyltransferase family 4 protein [Alphaproteobacteria bacterium]
MSLNKHLKVLMVVAHYPFPVVGGLEKQAHELSKDLVLKKVIVSVLSGKFANSQDNLELIDGVTVHRVGWPKNRFLRFFTMPFKIINFMFSNRSTFDIVHLHTISWFSLYILILAKCMNKKTVLKMANVGEWGLPPLKESLIGRLQLRIIKTVDVIVAMSNQSKKEICDIGYPVRNIFMTPNGISIPDNIDIKRSNPFKPCKVIFVGRLDKQKNINSLLRLWAELQMDKSRLATLEICGSGPLEDKLKLQVVELNISDTVIFRGQVSDVYKYLSSADIFILPSTAEGNSNAVLEAMVSGLPIISTNVGGTLMQVGSQGKDFIVEVNDSDKMRRILEALIGNSEKREKVGKEMYKRARNIFSMKEISVQYIQMYTYLNEFKGGDVYKIANKVFDV